MDADVNLAQMLRALLARSNKSMISSYVYFTMAKAGHPSMHKYTITVCINGKCFHGPTILTAVEAALNGTRIVERQVSS